MAATPINSFQEMRTEWEAVLASSPVNTLFLTPQWQEVWWDTFGDKIGLAGFYLSDGDGISAVASMSKSGDTLSLVGNQETFDYNDFMIRPGYEGTFYETLLSCMEDQNINNLQLYSLLESSPTLEHLPDLAKDRGYLVEVTQEDVTSGVDLPGNWEDYLASLNKKDRHELRRKFRRLEALPDWRWYGLTDPNELSSRLPDFISLMRRSNEEKDLYMTPAHQQFFNSVTRRMAELGLAKLFFLEIEGQPVASSLCFDYSSSRLLYNSGYNLDYSYYSVGLLLHALCLQDAIENGLEYFDFLRGPEPYKHHLGGEKRNLFQMVVTRS